ncbi:serine/threonine protein kinase [Candidatus Woesearchaeota archaeon]|nr:serine/threonine protein kinase [Candidatus Woesearchaeota archaeon]
MTNIGPYRTTAIIGKGAMGSVYKAYLNIFEDPAFIAALKDTDLPLNWIDLRKQISGLDKDELDTEMLEKLDSSLKTKAEAYDTYSEIDKQQTYERFCIAMKAHFRYKGENVPMQYLLPDFWRAIKLSDTSTVVEETKEEITKRFEREATTYLPHRNIVQTVGYDWHNGAMYIAMEYLDDANLRNQNLTLEESVDAVRQALDGLIFAHEAGVIHRDVKPDNLLRSRSTGVTKLCDLGIQKSRKKEEDLGITKDGRIVGSPYYFAPEQAYGGVSVRSDIYSLSATLLELIAGKPIVAGTNIVEIITNKINANVILARERAPEASKDLEDLITAGMASSPKERLTSYEFRTILDELILEGRLREGPAERRRQQLTGDDLARRVEAAAKEETELFQRIDFEKPDAPLHAIAESYEIWARKTTDDPDERIRLLQKAQTLYQQWINENWGHGAEAMLTSTISTAKKDIPNDPPSDLGPYGQPESLRLQNIIDRHKLIGKRIAAEKAKKKRSEFLAQYGPI